MTKLFRNKTEAQDIGTSPTDSVARSKMDLRVESPRRLLRQLHDLLDERGYEHEYEPLKAEKCAIGDIAVFESMLIGKKDYQRFDLSRLILACMLAMTIVFIPLAIKLLESSLYPLRTVARIRVEGEAYHTEASPVDLLFGETLDVVSDARVTLDLEAGVARDRYRKLKPTRTEDEIEKLEREKEDMQERFYYLMFATALPTSEAHDV